MRLHGNFLLLMVLMLIGLAGCGEPPVQQAAAPSAQPSPQAPADGQQPSGAAPRPTATPQEVPLPPSAPAGALVVRDITPGKPGGKLVIPMASEPKTFNPMFGKKVGDQFVAKLMFAGLVDYDSYAQKEKPALAQSWAFDEATLTWTFHLREGIRWSDGAPLTADDFLFFSELVFDPAIPNNFHYYFRQQPTDDSTPYFFSAPTSTTLTVKLPARDSFSFLNLSLMVAMPRHALQDRWKRGEFNEGTWGQSTDPAELVVSGPYRLKALRPNESISFERNPHFWCYDIKAQQLPYFDQVVALVVEDLNAAELRFLAGELDVIDQLSIKPDNLPQFMRQSQQEGKFTVYPLGASMDTTYYFFNLNPGGTYVDGKGERQSWEPRQTGQTPPAELKDFRPFVDPVKFAWFSNPDFRTACSMATNRQRMIDTVLYGEGAPLYGPIAPANKAWFNPKATTHPYDLGKAKALLEKAGFVDSDGDGIREDAQGHPVRFSIVSNRENNLRERYLQLLKEDLRAVGFDVSVSVVDFNSLITSIKSSFDYDACLLGLGTGVPPHPSMAASMWTSTGQVHWGYPEQKAPATAWEVQMDKLFEGLKQTFDPGQQKHIYGQLQELFAQMQPAVYLVSANSFVAARNDIGNLKPTIIRSSLTHNIEELYWTGQATQ